MNNKKGLTKLDVLVLVLVLAGSVFWGLPKYAWELEKAKATVANAVLLNVHIAENDVYQDTHFYTTNWEKLQAFLVLPSPAEAQLSAPDAEQSRLLSISGKKGGPTKKAFQIYLSVDAKEGVGQVSAVRLGSALYGYTLSRDFSKNELVCVGKNKISTRFCKQFLAYNRGLLEQSGVIKDQAEPVPAAPALPVGTLTPTSGVNGQ